MAITVTKNLPRIGVTIPVYVRLNSLGIKKQEQDEEILIDCFVLFYRTENDRNNGRPPLSVEKTAFKYDLESVDNIYKQGYDHLKTLPGYEDAADA